jgi:hypothetical protein
MTDITINIKTGSENSESKVTTTTDNAKVVPKTEAPKVETPKAETKEEPIPDKESVKKKDPAEINMIDKEKAILGDDKTKSSEESAPKKEAPKEEKPSAKDDSKKMGITEEEHAKMGSEK